MEKTLEELKEEVETVSLRLNGVQEEIAIKIKDGDNLYKRKIHLLELIDRLRNE